MAEAVYNRIAMLRAERRISRRQLADALDVRVQDLLPDTDHPLRPRD